MNGCVMTNNQVVSISDGVQKQKPRRVAIQATKVPSGIELHVELVPDSTAILPEASNRPVEVSASRNPSASGAARRQKLGTRC